MDLCYLIFVHHKEFKLSLEEACNYFCHFICSSLLKTPPIRLHSYPAELKIKSNNT